MVLVDIVFLATGAASFLIVLVPVVFIHELGHFALARLFGIRCEIFSVGFGRRLCGFRLGETDFRLSLIPLGGYVKMSGEDSAAAFEGQGGETPPIGDRKNFGSHPRWHKVAVALGGPLFNILTALLIPFLGTLYSGLPQQNPVVIDRVAEGSPAAAAGLMRGDRVVEIEGVAEPTWDEFRAHVVLAGGRPLRLVVERGGGRLALTLTPEQALEGRRQVSRVGVTNVVPALFVRVDGGSPAARAGFRPGAMVLSAGGTPVNLGELSALVRESYRRGEKSLMVTVLQGGVEERRELPLAGEELEDSGVRLTRRAGVAGAAAHALRSTANLLVLTARAVSAMCLGKRGLAETMSGPLGIAEASAQAAQEDGLSGMLSMIGLLSLNLGAFNLLPVPMLDGGLVALLGLESLLGLWGLSLSSSARERIQRVGYVALMLLMSFVVVNDFVKLMGPPSPAAKTDEAPRRPGG